MPELTSITERELESLRSAVASDPELSGLDEDGLAAALLFAPSPQAREPESFSVRSFLRALTAEDRSRVIQKSERDLDVIASSIREQDTEGILMWAEVLFEKGDIKDKSLMKIKSLIREHLDRSAEVAHIPQNVATQILNRKVGSLSKYEIEQIRG